MPTRSRWDLCLVLLVSLFVCRAPAGVWAAEEELHPGDAVTITADRAELGLRDKPAALLTKGDTLHVTEVRGVWVGGYAYVSGQRYTGWVHRNEVRLPGASGSLPVIQVPDRADDPAAVAAFKAAGVKLELNEQGRVQVLNALESQFTDAEAEHFAGLHQLASVELGGRPITDATLEKLAGCTTVQELYLDGTKITDQGLKQVQRLKNLEVLAMASTQVTDAGLTSLQGLAQLRVLNLGHCAITDEGLKRLQKVSYLEVLALPGTQVTDAGLEHLRPLVRLRVLNLIGDNIQGDGLPHLMHLPELRMLYLRQTKVSDEAVEQLDEALPSLAIYR